MIKVICQQCGIEFYCKPSSILRGGGKFCSRKCYYEMDRQNILFKKCLLCENKFKTHRNRVKKGYGKFCSRECMGKYQKGQKLSKERLMKIINSRKYGEDNPRWNGGLKASKLRTRAKNKNNPKYILENKIRGSIHRYLKKNSKNNRHWEDLVGYKFEQLENRLKNTMPIGYTWDNFIRGELHIDHIIPMSVFNFDKPEHIDFKKCWALENLQLLPARKNIAKHNKLLNTFQPSFKI